MSSQIIWNGETGTRSLPSDRSSVLVRTCRRVAPGESRLHVVHLALQFLHLLEGFVFEAELVLQLPPRLRPRSRKHEVTRVLSSVDLKFFFVFFSVVCLWLQLVRPPPKLSSTLWRIAMKLSTGIHGFQRRNNPDSFTFSLAPPWGWHLQSWVRFRVTHKMMHPPFYRHSFHNAIVYFTLTGITIYKMNNK